MIYILFKRNYKGFFFFQDYNKLAKYYNKLAKYLYCIENNFEKGKNIPAQNRKYQNIPVNT